MNGSVAAEQTPRLSHRDVRGFEMESFTLPPFPQTSKRRGERVRFQGAMSEGRREDGGDKKKRQTDRVGCTLQEEGLSQVSQNGFMYILIHN